MAAQIRFTPTVNLPDPWPMDGVPAVFEFDDDSTPVNRARYGAGVTLIEQTEFDDQPFQIVSGDENTDIVVEGMYPRYFRSNQSPRRATPLAPLYRYYDLKVRGTLSNSRLDRVYLVRHIDEDETEWNGGYGNVIRYRVFFRASKTR